MADDLYVRYQGAWVNLTQIHLIGGTDYHPMIWNDDGVYDRFYIDFKAPLQPFPLSTFNKCIYVLGKDGRITVTKATVTANSHVYAIEADITGQNQGIIVANVKEGLVLSPPESLPFFSEFFYVSGIAPVKALTEIYDNTYAPRYYRFMSYVTEEGSAYNLITFNVAGSETTTVRREYISYTDDSGSVSLI